MLRKRTTTAASKKKKSPVKKTTKRKVTKRKTTATSTRHKPSGGVKKTIRRKATTKSAASGKAISLTEKRLLASLSELETEAKAGKKMLAKAKGKKDKATVTVLDKLLKAVDKDRATLVKKLQAKS